MVHDGHALHLFFSLPEPVGVPNGYTVQVCHSPGPGADGRWHTFIHPKSLTYEIITHGTLIRFWETQANVGQTFMPAVRVAGRVLASRRLPELAVGALKRAFIPGPKSTVTVVEVVAPVGCKDPAACNREIGDDFLHATLDAGLTILQRWQRSLYVRSRIPLTLVTRERLPALLPAAVGDLRQGRYRRPTQRELRLIHENFQSVVPPVPLTGDDLSFIDYLIPQIDKRVFLNYLEFLRESAYALERDGDRRRSVLFSATACETFLDDLLGHLLWEEGQRPEEALAYFTGSNTYTLARRVRTQYHSRLKGNWDIDGNGKIGAWKRDVANLRNQVIHGGYEPGADETQRALGVTIEIVSYVSDLLTDNNVLKRYPVTALALMGEPGLRKRQTWSARMQKAGERYQEASMWDIAARWRLALTRIRNEAAGLGELPDESQARVYMVILESGREYWFQHDNNAGKARKVTSADKEAMDTAQGEALSEVRKQASADQTTLVQVECNVSPGPMGSWVEEYHLFPGRGVMVDGSDLDP